MDVFMPHGFCINWNVSLLTSFVFGELVTAFSYFVIGGLLFYIIPKIEAHGISGGIRPFLYLFGLFIMSCGVTHIFALISIWHPIYHLQSMMLVFTAIVSLTTAVILVVNIRKIRNKLIIEGKIK